MTTKSFKQHEIILMDTAQAGKSSTLIPTNFVALGFKERQDLEEWIKKNPAILGEDILLITSEFDGFDKSDKRLDLLALDKQGKLVIVELKRDAAGSLADLQAIRYAAFCSTMTFDKVVSLHAAFANIDEKEAARIMQDFVGSSDFSTIDKKPRIILAAGGFNDQELTSCVFWLRSFGVDISCVEITPYRMPNETRLILVPRVIIPLPEAQDYLIGIENKDAEEGRLSAAQKLYRERNKHILNHFRKLSPEKGSRMAPPKNYMQIPTGRAGIHFEWLFCGPVKDKKINVALHFETKSKEMNRRLCTALSERRKELEQTLGEPIQVLPDWTEEWSSVYIERPCEPWNDDVAHWASDKMHLFIQAAQPILDEFWSKERRA